MKSLIEFKRSEIHKGGPSVAPANDRDLRVEHLWGVHACGGETRIRHAFGLSQVCRALRMNLMRLTFRMSGSTSESRFDADAEIAQRHKLGLGQWSKRLLGCAYARAVIEFG
jgi:hypothetical protein